MAMTIGDIARIAGVSRATVSGVLNENPTVSEKTKEKVLAIIKEHNYRPNEVARALARNSTEILGLIVKDISNPLYSKISLGVDKVCERHGYSLIIGNTHTDWKQEIEHVNLLKRRRVDGLIIFPLQCDPEVDHLAELQDMGYPFVLLAEVPNIDADVVRADDEKGAFKATEHLINLRHKDISYVAGPENALASERRLQGFKNSLESNNISFTPKNMIEGGWRLEDGYQAGLYMIEHNNIPKGVLCYNDSVAIGFIRALTENGISVPDDVSVVGFDDAGAAAFLETSLTTVAQPATKIGRKAAELLLNKIKNKDTDTESQHIHLDTTLIVRETCGANKKGSVKINIDNGDS